jgi:hypothetical protein
MAVKPCHYCLVEGVAVMQALHPRSNNICHGGQGPEDSHTRAPPGVADVAHRLPAPREAVCHCYQVTVQQRGSSCCRQVHCSCAHACHQKTPVTERRGSHMRVRAIKQVGYRREWSVSLYVMLLYGLQQPRALQPSLRLRLFVEPYVVPAVGVQHNQSYFTMEPRPRAGCDNTTMRSAYACEQQVAD